MPLSINPEVTLDTRQVFEGILDPAFTRPDIRSQMSIREGIKANQQVIFLNRLNKVTRFDAGCGTGLLSKSIGMEELVWTPRPLKIFTSFCEDELETTFFAWLTNNGVRRRDVTNLTPFYRRWVLEVYQDAANEDLQRFAWLGDTAAANISGGGQITNGVAAEDYQQVDGFWKQIFADVTATTTPRITITENAAASFAAQITFTEDRAYQLMRAVYNNADSRLRARTDKVFLVSGWLFRNRIDQKESLTPQLESFAARQNEEFETDAYRNIPIINMENVWDRWLETDFTNGTVVNVPNRILLTTLENIVGGFDAVNAHNAFETWFERKDELVYFKGLYKADMKVMRPFLNSVAY